jgi:nucleoside-diphosphate-sugar epimerase
MTVDRNLRRVLVTGAAGFVGSELVHLLLEQRHDVIAVDDLSKGARASLPADGVPGFSFVRADLRDRAAALAVIRDCDWVIHLASQAFGIAYGDKHQTAGFLLNSQINANVVEAVVENHVGGVLVASSSCIYPVPTGSTRFTEDDGFASDPEPATRGYGWAKRMLEIAALEAAREGRCEAVVVRPVNIYGASYGWFGQHSHVIPTLVKRMLDGENPLTIWGDGGQVRNFIHVSDVARALLALSRHAPNETVVNVGPPDAIAINDLLEILKEELQVDCQIVRDLSKPTGTRVKDVSVARLQSILPEYRPEVCLRQGLAEMRHWYARHKHAGHLG